METVKQIPIIWLKDLVGEEAIKKKYRELAKQWHPDLNKDINAKTNFQAIVNEYEYITLSNIIDTRQTRSSNKQPIYDSVYDGYTQGSASAKQQKNPFTGKPLFDNDFSFEDFIKQQEDLLKARQGRYYNQQQTEQKTWEQNNKQREKKQAKTQFEQECETLKQAWSNIVRNMPVRSNAYIFSTMTSIMLEVGIQPFEQHYDYVVKELMGYKLTSIEGVQEVNVIAKHWFRIYQNLK